MRGLSFSPRNEAARAGEWLPQERPRPWSSFLFSARAALQRSYLPQGSRVHLQRGRHPMPNKNPLLSVALVVFGAAFLLIFPLSIVWSSGWAWNSGGPMASDYFLMIVAVYFTLGVFM